MMFSIPQALKDSETILIAGAGGGYDVFAGLPLLVALRAMGKKVILGNLSFTYLGGTDALQEAPGVYCIDAETQASSEYFPEGVLARFLATKGVECPIYAFEKSGVRPTQAGYKYLVAKYNIDSIVLIDGGTDILMRGDEAGLGTPEEDMVSLASVAGLDVATRLVYCLGFGVDSFHGVCHAHFLENVASIAGDGGFLGSMSLLADMPESELYLEAVRYSETAMSSHPSIVNTSIASAIEGAFGNVHRTKRTQSSELFISPLMSMYWVFDLAVVARHSLYLSQLCDTESIWDVQAIIRAFHSSQPLRARHSIPH